MGVIGHTTAREGTVVIGGLPLSDPSCAFLEAATLLNLGELVAVADYLVLDPRVLDPKRQRPVIALRELRGEVFAAAGRGSARARQAVELAREGVESAMETALRLLLRQAGLPEPVCGYELRAGNRRVGYFDLAWPEFRAIAEYDGDQHRTSTSQYERDIQRFDEAADLDWRVVRVRRRGVLDRPDLTIKRVSGALERGGWMKRRNGAQ
jgi:very-short-patch-repair endonuclease